ncbi:AF4/FMR2 family member 4-like [Drosophila navojoa]|uniref:AF4/FMR2 family member 4-like n=1 Tax=Drosophila navojoa TaxID=7232 RepID=UPI0011BE2A3C|nr:AF4/FMR2 family member 4-like [Drosophila navojoa]
MSNNNSTKRKLHYDGKLQSTSRITPKIREYLAELSNDRELGLERFMAFSSTTSTTSSNVSVGAPSSRCRSRSSSLGVATTAACAAAKTIARKQKECVSSTENVKQIPIVMDNKVGSGPRIASASVEDLRTPTKSTQTRTPMIKTRKTQTPESALKSHKRLEWDPAADVGYRYGRAASTSNISTLERSVLEAVIQPAVRCPGADRPNHSETDLNRLQQEGKKELNQQKPAAPLASSTLVPGNHTCSQPQATPTATPVATPTPVPSQSSRRESCATSAVSSFDYQHNSRPSTSQSNSGSQSQSQSRSRSRSRSLSAEELLRHVEQQRQEREYAAQLEQVLCNRRNTNKEKREHKENKENKENKQPPQHQQQQNISSCSSATSSPAKCDLDLGIDLLCSLVNKRSLSYGQKKQLIRDIAKRLACLDLTASSSSSLNGRTDVKRVQYKDAQLKEKHRREKFIAGGADTLRHSQPLRKDMSVNTSKRNSLEHSVPAATTPAPAVAPAAVPSPVASRAAATISPIHTATTECAPVSLAAPVPAPRTRLATPALTPLPSSYTSTSSATSNELVTQKTNVQIRYTVNAVDEQAAVQEWLNPMTQSEIEYEEKRLQRVQLDSERRTQLNWIETEILRLRKLQHLLTNAAKSVISPPSSAKSVRIPIQMAVEHPQVMPNAPKPRAPQQRSKMATPTGLSEHSGSTESVCSFVQQRQRQFMAHYQNQQQQRLEQQQQQQQQQLLLRQQQQQQHQRCPYNKLQQRQQQQPIQQQQNQYTEMQYTRTVGCLDEGPIYYQVVNSHASPCHVHAAAPTVTTTAAAAAAAAVTTAASTNGATTNSTSSMLCISSEMSIPLSLANACEATTTTTTTTTHQYDDVACHQQLQPRQHRRQSQRTSSSSEQKRPQQQQCWEGEQRQSQYVLQVRPRGIAYVIHFSSTTGTVEETPDFLSLQDHLQRARPQFCAQSKQRKAILNQMQLLRNARRKELEQLIEHGSLDSLDQRLKQLPPPVASRIRIFSTREMKALTSKRCEKLPEVIAAQKRECEERRRRSNRILRDVFNRRLQRRVRCGKLSLNHSRTVI